MKFTVNQIEKHSLLKPFAFDQEVDVSELEAMNNDIREIKPARIRGKCTVEGNEFVFTLNITGVMILPCARTLVDVPYSFDVDTVEIFSTAEYLTDEEIENEIYPVEGDVIDLTPCILENIALAIPYRVFSKDKAAQDHSLLKGEGWELTLEEELDEYEKKEKTIDPRLKKLETLLNNDKREK